jgi:hypothetical protein
VQRRYAINPTILPWFLESLGELEGTWQTLSRPDIVEGGADWMAVQASGLGQPLHLRIISPNSIYAH